MNTGTTATTGATATTHDIDIELPEPAFTAGTKIGTTTGFFCRDSKIKKGDGAYTREQVIAAIEADRKRRGEPVAEVIRDTYGSYTYIKWKNGYKAEVGDKFYLAPQTAEPSGGEPDVLPGEAVFGFSAWLTSLKTPVTFSECHGAAIGADLAVAYNKSQGFDEIREDFHKRLKPYPEQEPAQPAEPVSQHPDDAAVDAFAVAMKAKLAKKRTEGRGNWQMCTSTYLSRLLREHVEKGDPVDVANLAMMLSQNGQRIEATEPVRKTDWNNELSSWSDEDFIRIFHERLDLANRLRKMLADPVKVPQPHEFNTGNEKLDALLDDTFYLAKDGGMDNGIKWYESLQDFLQSIEPVKVDDKASVPSDDALDDALSNLEHDNYEQSYSGYKNRQADIALIRTALTRYITQ